MTTLCPKCNSHNPKLHPAIQEGGEVQPCSDPFHITTPMESWQMAEIARLKADLSRLQLKWQIDLFIYAAEHDIASSLFWSDKLEMFINCNDLFFWGCADLEPITESTFPELKQALDDAGDGDGPYLYCARRRKMRPQGATYTWFDKKNIKLFNACGPEREIGFGNPNCPIPEPEGSGE